MKPSNVFVCGGHVLFAALVTFGAGAERFTPAVPKVWDDPIIASLELPLSEPGYSPKHITADYYYRIPVRPIYKSYPVYHPDQEPSGYLESLRQRDPEVVWDEANHQPPLETAADWTRAGELVFDSPTTIGNGRIAASGSKEDFLHNRKWYERTGTRVTRDGILPGYSYIIREKGKVEIGIFSCAMCHTRIMPDGALVKGAQGNSGFHQVFAEEYRSDPALAPVNRALERMLFHRPWLRPDPETEGEGFTVEQRAEIYSAVPPGVMTRHRLLATQPVQIPDLIGVKSRRYLDRSGLQRHRDIGDLMRYAAMNQGADNLASFGGFVPLTALMGGQPLPENPKDALGGTMARYSDEQLYALALFIYSLKPPPSPHPLDARAARGKEIFATEGCAKCHDPEQGYTNNKLIAAPGFVVPTGHPEKENIMRHRIDTDPALTLTTRRGTGFYKVPSLLGLWYRGPFEHNGSLATLEDWFDPKRLDNDYVPTGWKGPPGTKTRAIKGHEFGLDLANDERAALISFLQTL